MLVTPNVICLTWHSTWYVWSPLDRHGLHLGHLCEAGYEALYLICLIFLVQTRTPSWPSVWGWMRGIVPDMYDLLCTDTDSILAICVRLGTRHCTWYVWSSLHRHRLHLGHLCKATRWGIVPDMSDLLCTDTDSILAICVRLGTRLASSLARLTSSFSLSFCEHWWGKLFLKQRRLKMLHYATFCGCFLKLSLVLWRVKLLSRIWTILFV